MPEALRTKAKSVEPLPLDHWISYRFGLIATRLGEMAKPHYAVHYKMSTAAWRALAVVARFEPLSATMLSGYSRLDASKVSRALETLVGRRLVTREKDPADQRRVTLRLTARGREIYYDVAAAVSQIEHDVTATLTAAERKILFVALDKIDTQIARKSDEH